MINGILWRTRTGAPWRDVPGEYGPWGTVYGRHRTWSADGTWEQILTDLQRGSDGEVEEWVVSVDSTVVRAHQDAAGARKAAPADVAAARLAVALTESAGEEVGDGPAGTPTGGSVE